MICRRCLQRASGFVTRGPTITTATTAPSSTSLSQHPATAAAAARSTRLPILTRPFSQTITARSSSPAPTPPSSETPPPVLSTPLGSATPDAAAGSEAAAPLSSCLEGTVLTGLNYFKNKTDPVALADGAYPTWLWRCLDVQKKADEEDADDAGDEFSKSRKQRRLAAKKQRMHEARLLAEGNLEALAPKIPMQHQSINLPGNEEGTPEGAVAAAAAREKLRKAMRKERRANIKESNYLKSM